MLPSGVKQLKLFSVVLHKTPNYTTSVKQLPYFLEIKSYVYKNRFLDIFPWPDVFKLIRANTVYSAI